MVKNESNSADIESIEETVLDEQKDEITISNPTLDCEFCGSKVEQRFKNRPKRFCSVKCSNKKAKAKQVQDTAQRHLEAGKVKCGYCKIEVDAVGQQGGKRRWCSADCKSHARVESKTADFQKKLLEQTNCRHCTKLFPKFNSVKGLERYFCSKPCYRAQGWIDRKVSRKLSRNERQKKVPCSYCGTEIDYLSSYGKVRKFCSGKCRQTQHHLKRRGLLEGAIFAITPKEWERLKARFNYCCAYCGSSEPLTFDHVIPVIRGGAHSIANAMPCCRTCNCSKNSKTLSEWRKYLRGLSEGDPRKIKLSSAGAFQGFLKLEEN